MKRKDILPYIMAICGVGIFSANADADTATYRFPEISVDALKIDTVSEGASCTFAKVAVEGYTHRWEDGEPMVPVRFQTIKVPAQTTGFKATVKNSRKSGSIRLGHPLIPGRLIPTDGSSVADHPYRMSGKGFREMPAGPEVKIENDFYANGTEHYIVLGITPFVYDCELNALDIYTNVEIELSYEQMKPEDPNWALINQHVYKMYEAPYTDLLEMELDGKIVSVKNSTSRVTSNETDMFISNYVILVPGILKDACKDLVTWKRMKGYKVELLTFEEIYDSQEFGIASNSKCYDKASSVREWLKKYMAENGALYCLIIGDYNTNAPIRKFRDHSRTTDYNQPADVGLIPSDAYFSDLNSNWDYYLGRSGIYEIDVSKASFSGTIPVGRLICSEKEEIKNYIRKLILYELFPGRGDMDYLGRGVRMQHPDNPYDGNVYGSLFKHLKQIEYDDFRGTCDKTFSKLKPEPSAVIEKMRNAGLYTFQTHGGPLAFKISQLLKSDGSYGDTGKSILSLLQYKDSLPYYLNYPENIGLDSLNNIDKPSVFYSLACDVAFWDPVTEKNGNITGDLNREKYNPASSFTVAGNYGGVAFLGNSRNGWFSSNNCMEVEFSKALSSNDCLGIAENISKINYASAGINFTKSVLFRHNIIGDPDIKVWLCKPEFFQVTPQLVDNYLVLGSSSLNEGEIGTFCKDKNTHRYYRASNGILQIPMSSFTDANGNTIGVVFLKQKGYLPYTQLVTSGEALNSYNNSFILRELNLKKAKGSSYAPILNVGVNSVIDIKCLSDIVSDEGIKVGRDSKLILDSDAHINLSGDKIESGGKMVLKAKDVGFGLGFEIESGGELTINME